MATSVPKAGGLFVPVRLAFGNAIGLLAGWTDWLSYVAGAAMLAVVSAEFFALLVPAANDHIAITATGVALGSMLLNYFGVKEGAAFQLIGSLLKASFLFAIIAIIFLVEPTKPAAPQSTLTETVEPLGLFAIVAAYQLVYGAFAGWTAPVNFSEEDVNTSRNLPRGLFLSLLTITGVYFLVNASLLSALPVEQMRASELPVAVALENIFGATGGKIVAGGALLLAASCMNSSVMVMPRIIYGLGRDGLFPNVVTKVNRGGTPHVALLCSMALMIALVFTGGFDFLFRLMGALTILILVLYQASLFGLRRKFPNLERPYRARLYPWLPAAVLVLDAVLLVLFVTSDFFGGAVMLGLVAICLPIGHYLARERGKAS
nr:APC family permease [Sphingomicrobium sp. B8]